MFVWRQLSGIKVLELTIFKKHGVSAYFTGRAGGVSTEAYSSLNLALHTDDRTENVLENRRKLAGVIGVSPGDFVAGQQVHGNHVYTVKEEDRGRGALCYSNSIPATDALITAEKRLPLISFYADCVPLLFMDPEKKVIALAHAGWKGTANRIAEKTLISMRDNFGCRIADILAVIGPSISKNCYQVGDYVMTYITKGIKSWEKHTESIGKGYYLLDLKGCNHNICKETGVKDVVISDYCTCCDNNYFYSYRGEGETGRMASIIIIE